MVIHGGDIYRNNVVMDFSVNVNPLGMPEAVRETLADAVSACMRYPDPEAEELKAAVSSMLSVRKECLLFGNGASELFLAVIHALKPKCTVIPVPSFYGYEHAAAACQGEVIYYPLKREKDFVPDEEILSVLDAGTDLLFLANPNNPTGNLIPLKILEKIVRHCRENEIYVVLDECFIEFCPRNESFLSRTEEYDNVLLVRAFTKSFAIPGVRLGYLIGSNQNLLLQIGSHLPEWNLSVFAQMAGIACTKEKAFLDRTVHYVEQEGAFLAAGLEDAGLEVFPGEANFILAYTKLPLYEMLLERGILIRDCSNFRGLSKGYYRIAVKSREENIRLLNLIRQSGKEVFL